MVGSRKFGEHADTCVTRLQEDLTLLENPARSRNATHTCEQRYSLDPDRIDLKLPSRKPFVWSKYSSGEWIRQATIVGSLDLTSFSYCKRGKPPFWPHSPRQATREQRQPFDNRELQCTPDGGPSNAKGRQSDFAA